MRDVSSMTTLLELTKSETCPRLPENAPRSLCFDACGHLLLSWRDASGSVYVKTFGPDPAEIKFDQIGMNFPIAQRFSDGCWLLVDARCQEGQRNAKIFGQNLKETHAFEVGDAVEQVIVDLDDNIWVGHFDENPLGLRRYSRDGRLTYDYANSSGYDIFDLYAMHLDLRGVLWVYPYPEFYLSKVVSSKAEMVLAECPVRGAKAILAGRNHVAFLGNYDNDDALILNLNSMETSSLRLLPDSRTLQGYSTATYGETAAFLSGDGIYQVSLIDLIKAAAG